MFEPYPPAMPRLRLTAALLALAVAATAAAAPGAEAPRTAVQTDPPRWTPPPRPTWHWQLSGRLDTTARARIYDIDLFDHGADVVRRLRARGRRVVCYTSVGTAERGRADVARLPRRVVGKPLPDWPAERWLDVRRLDVLGPWIERRIDLCARKGFDAVEPDNVDAYANDSGFPLSGADQLRFNRFVARAAHVRGLAVALKNDLDQVAALEPDFDFAVVEQCFEYDECERLAPFVAAGKPVLVAEYGLPRSAFCREARAAGLMAVRKRLALGAWRRPCW